MIINHPDIGENPSKAMSQVSRSQRDTNSASPSSHHHSHCHHEPVSFYEISSVSGNVSPKSPLCGEERHLASHADDNSRPNHTDKAQKNWDEKDEEN